MSAESGGRYPARNNVEQMAQIGMNTGAFNFIRNVEMMVRIVMGWSTCTLEVWVRHDFGERYLTVGRIILGWLTIRMFLSLSNLQNSLSWLPGIEPMTTENAINRFYITCYLLFSCVHLYRIWYRNFSGVPWHSHSFGRSYLDFLTWLPPLRIGKYSISVTEWMLYRFIEPALCFAVVYYFFPGGFTRSWLLWSSLAMLVHNNMVFGARRSRFLDMLDSHIESGYYNQLQSESTGQQSAYRNVGYVEMALPPIALPESTEEIDMAATVAETMGMTTEVQASE